MKKIKNTYMYTLVMPAKDTCESTVMDIITAETIQDAYGIAVQVCNEINKKYNKAFSVQSVSKE